MNPFTLYIPGSCVYLLFLLFLLSLNTNHACFISLGKLTLYFTINNKHLFYFSGLGGGGGPLRYSLY